GSARGNTAALRFQPLAHMWRLDRILFKDFPCPAIVVDNCWDWNWTNIDILSCTNRRGDPSVNASVILGNGCNNGYLRGVRIESAQSGAYYFGDPNARLPMVGGAQTIYVINGKVDLGYGKQYAAAVTITLNGGVNFSDWSLSGVNGQYCFDLAG